MSEIQDFEFFANSELEDNYFPLKVNILMKNMLFKSS